MIVQKVIFRLIWALNGDLLIERLCRMSRVLINNDVSSLYPNLVRLFNYSSRNQSDKDSYVKILT